jgi:hypothetical protein
MYSFHYPENNPMLYFYYSHFLRKKTESQVWWCMPVIPELRKLRGEDVEFKASLSYTVRILFQETKS